MTDNQRVSKFLKMVKSDLKRHGYKLKLENKYRVHLFGSTYAKGYFCPDDKVIKVGTKRAKEEWLSILVHEYCHFKQVIGKSKMVASYDKICERVETFNYKHKKNKDFYKAINLIVRIELDCEKRSVQMIKKYKLPIDIGVFIQRANASLFYYYFDKKKNKENKRYDTSKKKFYGKFKTTFEKDFLNPSQRVLNILYS